MTPLVNRHCLQIGIQDENENDRHRFKYRFSHISRLAAYTSNECFCSQ